MRKLYAYLISLFSLVLITINSNAQVSNGGVPFFLGDTINNIQTISVNPNRQKAEVEERRTIANSRFKQVKYGNKIDINKDFFDYADFIDLESGERVWRLRIKSENAYSLSICFNHFDLSEKSKLFFYNADGDMFLGAFTDKNNKSFKRFSTQPVKGNNIIIELIQKDINVTDILDIDYIIHDFKDLYRIMNKGIKRLSSEACQIDVNCTEGIDWQDEKHSVCKIISLGYLGTGALINTTLNNGDPYFLTARHVISSQAGAQDAIFIFNYDALACGSKLPVEQKQTISGAQLLASAEDMDFSLLLLSSKPKEEYFPYFAGWDATGDTPTNTTCIHHPSGDVKKISKDNDSPLTATYQDQEVSFKANTHWEIVRWDSGSTEGGSSGSPLFNQNKLIIGDLTGGSATCLNPLFDYYSKISSAWNTHPEDNKQLKKWLDPTNSGQLIMTGFKLNDSDLAHFTISKDTICMGESIYVVASALDSDLSFNWDFGEDASPQTAEGRGPFSVSYSTKGAKAIKLVVSNSETESIFEKAQELRIFGTPQVDFDYIIKESSIELNNLSTDSESYIWDFGNSKFSTDQNTSLELEKGTNDVKINLKAINRCGNSDITKDIDLRYENNIKTTKNPSRNGAVELDFGSVEYDNIILKLVSISTGKIVLEKQYSSYSPTIKFQIPNASNEIYNLYMIIDGKVWSKKIININ
ncbi:MAG: trypsin-like peptidase domain-containing protein [Marinifilaceae bacterium]|jgi:hypothetical protein|nr:trypsin-like peptidase domain-containing protein [Marinifilaceae bacterium]